MNTLEHHQWVTYRLEQLGDDFRTAIDRFILNDHGTGLGHDVQRSLEILSVPIDADACTSGGETILIELRVQDSTSQVEVRFGSLSTSVLPRHEVIEKIQNLTALHRLHATDGKATLHASSAADASGRAILALGPSGAGKSTIAARFVEQGLTLLSDEQVTVYGDADLISGFTRPISLHVGGGGFVPRNNQADISGPVVSATALGGRYRLAAKPTLTVLLDRDSSSPARWSVLQPFDAVAGLSSNSLDIASRPYEAMHAMVSLATKAPTIRLQYHDSDEAAALLIRLLATPPRVGPTTWRMIASASDDTTANRSSRVTKWASDLITVVIDDRAAVYHSRHRSFVQLNESATMVWLSLEHGRRTVAREQVFLDRLEGLRLLDDDVDTRRRWRAQWLRARKPLERQWIGPPVRPLRSIRQTSPDDPPPTAPEHR